jgi:hypothetical protein
MMESLSFIIFPKVEQDIVTFDEKGSLPIGKLKMRTQHINICSIENTAKDCKKTDTIIIGQQETGQLTPDELTDVPVITYQKASIFDYIVSYGDDIDSFETEFNRQTDRERFKSIMQTILKDGRFLDKNTIVGCEVDFTNYTPATDLYLTTRITFEFTPAGLVRPKQIDVLPLRPKTN